MAEHDKALALLSDMPELPAPEHRERVYGGHGDELVYEYYSTDQMLRYGEACARESSSKALLQIEDDAEVGRRWRENSSLEAWFPLTAERLKALEAAANLAPPPPTDDQADAAAKKLAECMDYPWAHMPEQGRESMRQHARAILAAAAPAEARDAADAARYRWLRAGRLLRQGHDTGVGRREIQRDPLCAVMSFGYWCSPEALDAAIDAAMAASSAAKGQA